MIITIKVPDNVVKLQYATQENEDYEQWATLTFGEIVNIQAEQNGGKDTDVPAKGGAEA